MLDEKTNTDRSKEFTAFSKSGLSQREYCKKRGIKNTNDWERRSKKRDRDGFVEILSSVVQADLTFGSEFLILKIDLLGKAHLPINL
ncbi:hypothetical protein LEP1GSC036_0501 [Leptospira weilii str. 2006001853]|uniref:Uncharacterized protein n=1 Tax=Leptospira weilii str. 2006001853 TaxID=1001589 RepID=A0A828Z2J4_9LEPT|nr:hypothetical protein [Leptospira weilii]EKR65228.1 hypothetical protein LEP1GSC036_0501 [Leptospira weilii str. 2006001853]QDK26032.1 hypothetical protein FHG68_04415 [Leptospira weilii]